MDPGEEAVAAVGVGGRRPVRRRARRVEHDRGHDARRRAPQATVGTHSAACDAVPVGDHRDARPRPRPTPDRLRHLAHAHGQAAPLRPGTSRRRPGRWPTLVLAAAAPARNSVEREQRGAAPARAASRPGERWCATRPVTSTKRSPRRSVDRAPRDQGEHDADGRVRPRPARPRPGSPSRSCSTGIRNAGPCTITAAAAWASVLAAEHRPAAGGAAASAGRRCRCGVAVVMAPSQRHRDASPRRRPARWPVRIPSDGPRRRLGSETAGAAPLWSGGRRRALDGAMTRTATPPCPSPSAPARSPSTTCVAVARDGAAVRLDAGRRGRDRAGPRAWSRSSPPRRRPAYGISTGFGALATRHIPTEMRAQLQRSLVRSHAAGSGPEVEREVVRGADAAAALDAGDRAHRRTPRDRAAAGRRCCSHGITPVVHEYGSLGCSGDLAPLSHCALALMGEGEVRDASGTPDAGRRRARRRRARRRSSWPPRRAWR